MPESIRRNFRIMKSLLRIPTFLLMLLYLTIGFLTGIFASTENTSINLDLGDVVQLFICGLVIATWYICGSGLNDYADYEIDRINLKGDKDRPLVVGLATRQMLLLVVALCSALALAFSALLSWQHVLLTASLLLLNVTYSIQPFQISRRGGLAPVLLPLGYIILPFYLGYMLHSHHYFESTTILLVAAYYLHFAGRIILKDYRDVKGDKAHGKLTFLLRHGNVSVCIVSGTAIAISGILIILVLNPYMHIFKYGLLFLLFFGLSTLYQLAHTTHWRQQKPLLSAFGRSMTGVTALTIVTLMHALWPFSVVVQIVLTLAIIGVYSWSAQQAYLYNKATLQ